MQPGEHMLRERLYERGYPIQTAEVPRAEYLGRLSVEDHSNILAVMHAIRDACKRRIIYQPAVFAVGTTTYSEDYWSEIRALAEKSANPTLVEIAQRRGEDIDLLFANDMYTEGEKNPHPYVTKGLRKANIRYRTMEAAPFGVCYFEIPQGEEKVRVRTKGVQYETTVFARFPTGRPIHIYFSVKLGELCMKDLRVQNLPFSTLTRHGDVWELERIIKQGNQTGDFNDYHLPRCLFPVWDESMKDL
jgi:hypothetical protein